MLNGQTSKNIEKVIQLGDAWKFDEAIDSLKHYIGLDPENPELYYWLGRYAHYKVSDSRPYPGKGDQWSREEVLKPLQKAVQINPNYGDAKYFLAAEYGARAMEALRRGDVEQYKQELLDAKSWGGFPAHALEHGRNVLKSCDPNTILIVNGDAHTNVLQYLQVIEGYRKDVSVLALAYLERPFFIKLIRDGIPGIFKPVPINMSDNLIMEMHDYKWRENDVIIPVSEQTRTKYSLNDTVTQFVWHIKPDVGKVMLQPVTAMLINIMEANQWERPVHYIFFGFQDLNGLENNMRIEGLTAEIYPVKVKGTDLEYDRVKFESVMLDPKNYVDYPDIVVNDQPRVSYSFGQLNRRRIFDYAIYLFQIGEKEKSEYVVNKMIELMPPETFPLPNDILSGLEYLERMRKKQLADLFAEGESIDNIISLIKTENTEGSEYDLSESGINVFGYSLMEQGKNEEALKIFKINTELFPEGYNTWDSYGECLLKLGQKEGAIEAYKKSLELNPDNTNASNVLKNNP
jgi:tetratricopeptide (TPR) repeat protein